MIKATRSPKRVSPWAWIPSLYFAEGIPYVIVMTIAVVMYKRLGVSNTDAALYTSWLYLPWVIKPFWSPLVDLIKTKRWWIWAMQLLIGAALAGIAFTLNTSPTIQATLAFFWLIAFSSATHDIAADGFYMLGLDTHDQALFVGIRSTFYRIATIFGQGLLIAVAGFLELYTRKVAYAWSLTFYAVAGLFIALFLYHKFILPRPTSDRPAGTKVADVGRDFLNTFITFFRKPYAAISIAFMLLYRLPEARGAYSLGRWLAGESDEALQALREEILSTTNDDFRAFAPILKEAASKGETCVIGGANAARAAEEKGWRCTQLL